MTPLGGFFDPADLLQVKYEMVRQVEVEGVHIFSATIGARPGPPGPARPSTGAEIALGRPFRHWLARPPGRGAAVAVVPGHELIEDSSEIMQLVQMSPGQPVQYQVTLGRQADTYHAAVILVRYPLDQSGGLGPVDELDRAMRPEQKVSGEVAYGGRPVSPVPFDRHEQLVLNVSKAGGLRLVFAPALKAAQGDPELKQPLEVLLG